MSKKGDSLTLTPQVRTEGIEGFAGGTNTWRANDGEEDSRRIYDDRALRSTGEHLDMIVVMLQYYKQLDCEMAKLLEH